MPADGSWSIPFCENAVPFSLYFGYVGYTIGAVAAIALTNLTKRFAGDVTALDNVSLEMSPYDLTKGRITFRHLAQPRSAPTGGARR